MPARCSRSRTLAFTIVCALSLASLAVPDRGQQPPGRASGPPSVEQLNNPDADIDVAVRDAHGSPLEVPAFVRLHSVTMSYNEMSSTQGASKAHFSRVPPGDYEVEVSCPGYRKAAEHFIMMQTKVSLPCTFTWCLKTSPQTSEDRLSL